ncbi:dTDP-4-dehydrorhamnose reductase [Marinicrinis sediminis]|uniref:dTDP-4-dehydrorhamnose reductase n=1 Tax=Marinicrinis sediminis TaxID=1652465 RepID=A0ABW5RAE8_9BACL
MILLTGANGQLGRDFQQLFVDNNIPFIPTHYKAFDGYMTLDVTDIAEAERIVREYPVTHIINCAAYNNVDLAEEESDRAFLLNREVPRQLARLAESTKTVFVTFSTDFVFDGTTEKPYVETDPTDPLNVYGQSKLAGEQAVLSSYDRVFVIRTSWVFGIGNHNFNKSVLNWSKSRRELIVVDDQVSVPTYSKDLAAFSWDLIQSDAYGLYHLSNQGEASKYDQAKYVLEQIGWQGIIQRGKTDDFKLPAKRAPYSKLNSTKAENRIGRRMPHWQDAVVRFLEEMKQRGEWI